MATCAAALLLLSFVTIEERALSYLEDQVARWFPENGCMSCHNNGDAARALFKAREKGYETSGSAIADTLRWLSRPSKWHENRSKSAFSDEKLARIQFATALAASPGASQDAIRLAAAALVVDQAADGAWYIDSGEGPGSPVTYGTALATYLASRVMEASGERAAAARANAWLLAVEPKSVPEAAAKLLAHSAASDAANFLVRAQNPDSGWGPHLNSPSEAFDTALALLALQEATAAGRRAEIIQRGRDYLRKTQQPSGGWSETTRPAGYQSYAQHISTTAWALLALLSTRP